MDTEAMIGSMGLTFFCNRCVEAFHEFRKQHTGVTDNLKNVCLKAIHAFTSLKDPLASPEEGQTERIALFDTNLEIDVFINALGIKEQESLEEQLDRLIADLRSVIDISTPDEDKFVKAERMQKFFDTLGDYSFYATRDCIEYRNDN